MLLVDHQVGLYIGVRDTPLAELKHNVVALAKSAQVFKLPLIVTTTAADSMWGSLIPELTAVLPLAPATYEALDMAFATLVGQVNASQAKSQSAA